MEGARSGRARARQFVGTNSQTGQAYPRDTARESLSSFGEYALGGVFQLRNTSDYSVFLDRLSNTTAIGELSYNDYPKYRAWNHALYYSGGVALLSTRNHKFPINIAVSNPGFTTVFHNGGYGSQHPGGPGHDARRAVTV